ncbi:phenazine-specific anthranilate synthase component I [Streptomyces longispororuber]|uniref:anthranilate synthase n=1 Tax=Streptomyces longispororuber TaxID=68230 RepID=A0A919DJR6_9ACTN|nr:anthranilate synthase family protein [Streptomyces longispororuber]GHE49762.1 phenazine-specific anthranilate synthase component I [Streptomyces longispororuber]
MPPHRGTSDMLHQVLDGSSEAFALLHRPETVGRGTLEVLLTDATQCTSLADLPVPAHGPDGGHELLALIPYRQIAERGFAVHDDGEPLMVHRVRAQQALPLDQALSRLPHTPVKVDHAGFNVSDSDYADIVRRVIADEIGTGEGANFVIKRSFTAHLPGFSVSTALAFFRRLLEREAGAYWTFLIHTGDRTFVGATPERHLSVRDGTAVMNPISGTYRYPANGPTLQGLLAFLSDRKEADELYMVLDEELKMMARICPSGGRVVGPHLKEMARLAHTEYLIEGRTDRDVRDILRETLFAPTVTGSPLENAAKVISRHEPTGRGYYSGVAALIGRDVSGAQVLDSAILIRTADISAAGLLRIGVGATLVRHSNPDSEVRETHAKAAGLLAALREGPHTRFADHPDVRTALGRRNDGIADFWQREPDGRAHGVDELAARRVLVIDAEDTFTAMIAQQLRAMGPEVIVRRFDEDHDLRAHDLVVMGPGPGDPCDARHPKVAYLRALASQLLDERQPFLAVCLSHQVLSSLLGLAVVRRPVPHQGVQREISLFGRTERVGFYNAFAARSDLDWFQHPAAGTVEVSRDPKSGEIHALRGSRFASVQFHAESVLTRDGPRIIRDLLTGVVRSSMRQRFGGT